MLSGPLQLYGSMLQNIRDDHFRPDESRTSRLVAFLERAEHADNAPDPTPPDSIVPEPVVSGVGPLLGVGEVESSAQDAAADGADSSSEIPSASGDSSSE